MPEEVAAKPLTFEIKRNGDSTVVACQGRLVAGTAGSFYEEIKPLLSECKVLVVDLAELSYIDSMGLGTLVRLYAGGRHEGCEFKLLHLGKQVRNLLRLTNLLSVFSQAESDGITIA